MSLPTTQILLKQLRDFGLNPKDWKLLMGKKGPTVKVINEEDSNLQFIGVIDWSKNRWQSLTLNTQF